MARGGGLRKGLTMGLAAGVGVAVLRAARARRAAPPAGAAPPTWPPLPTATTAEPPAAAAVLPAPPADLVEPAVGAEGTEALVAEAAMLEAAGVTEAAEVDEDAVAASRGSGQDLEAIILAEEAALEAERLEAERLELARLERTRTAADAEGAGLEREREEALARFAAQREEAQALLALQEEREAKAADSGPQPHDERPAGYLPGDGSDGSEGTDDAEAAALDDLWPEEIRDLEPPVSLLDADELPAPTLEPLVPDDAVADLDEEPAWGVAVLPEPQPQPEHASDVAEGERTAEQVWATGTDPEPEPALVPPGAAAHGGDDGAGLDAAVDEGGDLRPIPLDQVDDDDDARRPLMAGDLESGLGQDRYVPPPDEGQAEPLSAWPAARTEFASDDVELEEEAEDAPEAERDAEPRSPEVEVGSAAAATNPAETPSVSSGRSRITARAFDDAPPADLGEGDGEEAPAPAAVKRQRRSGQPRVPLKARRLPDDAADAAPPAEPAEPATTAGDLPAKVDPVQPGPPEAEPVPTAATVTKAAKAAKAAKAGKTTRAAKTGGTPSSAAAKAAVPPAKKTSPPATKVTKAVSVSKKATPAAGAAAPATTAKAPSAKKISSRRQKQGVLWVEPVGGSCPTSYPVKASLSSGIFHVVGGLFYERTRPDRCYRDEAAATADGLRQAKR